MAYTSALSALLVLAFVAQSVYALRCWSCSSDVDPQCGDYFNTTAMSRRSIYDNRRDAPSLIDCDSQKFVSTYNLNQRGVCMKKIQTNYGRKITIRQCHFIMNHESVGTCPSETTSSSVVVDFCEYCDHDGCNGANTFDKNIILTALIPVALILLFRQ